MLEAQTTEAQPTTPEDVAKDVVENTTKAGEAPEKLPKAPEKPKKGTSQKKKNNPIEKPSGPVYTMFTPRKDGKGWKKVKSFQAPGRVALVEKIEEIRPSNPRTEIKVYKGSLTAPAKRSVYWMGPDTYRLKTHWVIGGVPQAPSPLA